MLAAIQGNEDVADNLQHQTRGKDLLVLWLDCDREGEAIGFEVRSVAQRMHCTGFCRLHVSANHRSSNGQCRTGGGIGIAKRPCLDD